ncbi:unnamed protein product [Owenia fusiformis]|uniref:Uncharacterized protein n=1 Tax=Owenia fusiformis TaxID=6347 RepID=A0A8J1UIQ9_OWEFU|nr:unnamed protein product [Owenia fusiformis]
MEANDMCLPITKTSPGQCKIKHSSLNPHTDIEGACATCDIIGHCDQNEHDKGESFGDNGTPFNRPLKDDEHIPDDTEKFNIEHFLKVHNRSSHKKECIRDSHCDITTQSTNSNAIPLRRRHLPASFWKEPSKPQQKLPLPPMEFSYGATLAALGYKNSVNGQLGLRSYEQPFFPTCDNVHNPDITVENMIRSNADYILHQLGRKFPPLETSSLNHTESTPNHGTFRHIDASRHTANRLLPGHTDTRTPRFVDSGYIELPHSLNINPKESMINNRDTNNMLPWDPLLRGTVGRQHIWRPVPRAMNRVGLRYHPYIGLKSPLSEVQYPQDQMKI